MSIEVSFWCTVFCEAPADIFEDWEDVSEETKAELDSEGSIPCGGERGNLSPINCSGCRYGTVDIGED